MLNKLFIQKTDNTLIQLFRYTFVGSIAFVIDFSCLYLLTDIAELHYLFSAAIAFIHECILVVTIVFNGA
jgi:putative flippase GtrA